ncbi:MAG: DUF2085 domain-containing protein [Thermomicrobiales bacterium]
MASAEPMGQGAARVVRVVDAGVAGFVRHWLLAVNAIMAGYVGLAALAPLLRAADYDLLARPIYAAFGLICHQRPERSFHLAGHQMACCERCAAIYGALFLGGLAFALVRARFAPLSLAMLAVLFLPMAVDGLTQVVGLRESTWELRVLTGSLFGFGLVWFVFPHLERGFKTETTSYSAVRRCSTPGAKRSW